MTEKAIINSRTRKMRASPLEQLEEIPVENPSHKRKKNVTIKRRRFKPYCHVCKKYIKKDEWYYSISATLSCGDGFRDGHAVNIHVKCLDRINIIDKLRRKELE